jgi:hypothetical protein
MHQWSAAHGDRIESHDSRRCAHNERKAYEKHCYLGMQEENVNLKLQDLHMNMSDKKKLKYICFKSEF